MKESYVVRIPFTKKGFFDDKFSLTDEDVNSLKNQAKKEGRSLRVFIAYKLKKIAKEVIN